jgi:hypothetical protein
MFHARAFRVGVQVCISKSAGPCEGLQDRRLASGPPNVSVCLFSTNMHLGAARSLHINTFPLILEKEETSV